MRTVIACAVALLGCSSPATPDAGTDAAPLDGGAAWAGCVEASSVPVEGESRFCPSMHRWGAGELALGWIESCRPWLVCPREVGLPADPGGSEPGCYACASVALGPDRP